MKGFRVPNTKIHHAFTRAPTVYQNLLWVSSNYRQIKVKEAQWEEAPCFEVTQQISDRARSDSSTSQPVPAPSHDHWGSLPDLLSQLCQLPGSHIPSSAPGRTIPFNNYSSCSQNSSPAPSHLYPTHPLAKPRLGWDSWPSLWAHPLGKPQALLLLLLSPDPFCKQRGGQHKPSNHQH